MKDQFDWNTREQLQALHNVWLVDDLMCHWWCLLFYIFSLNQLWVDRIWGWMYPTSISWNWLCWLCWACFYQDEWNPLIVEEVIGKANSWVRRLDDIDGIKKCLLFTPLSSLISIYLFFSVLFLTILFHQHVAVWYHCDLIARITYLKCMLIGIGIVFSLISCSIRHISIISAPCYSWLWVSNDNGFKKSKFACKKNKTKTDKVTSYSHIFW